MSRDENYFQNLKEKFPVGCTVRVFSTFEYKSPECVCIVLGVVRHNSQFLRVAVKNASQHLSVHHSQIERL